MDKQELEIRNNVFAATSTATSYNNAAIEIREDNNSGATGTPPHLGFHWGGVVASQLTIESNGTIVIRDNPGTGYEDFKALNITATGVVYASGGNSGIWNSHTSNTGTVTSVATGNGISGGTITTTGTLTVGAGNGLSQSADGLLMSGSYTGGFTATTSMTSPIYYDANDGGYYGDFASTSVFNKINTGIGNLGRSRMASYSMTAGNWYRIANGSGRACGDIYIQDGISGGPHGNITFYAGSSYSQYAGTMLKLKSSSFYSVIGFTEIRLLIGTTYQDQFVEILCQRTGTYYITVQDTHANTNNWTLSTSATVGSVPTGYSDSTRLDINGMLIAEAGNGSNRFAVDRVGAIHLSGGTSGSSGQVLTSGGTGSPTWTTLQNQTGGPFLPLAGGIMSGEIGRSAWNSGYQVGGYNNIGASHAKTNPIHVIGTSYEPTATGLSNMYGIGYTRGDASFLTGTGGWGMYVAAAGLSKIFLDGENGGIGTALNSWRAPIFYDSNNTAYYGDFASTTYGKYFGRLGHAEGFQVGSYNNIGGGNSAKTNPIYTIGSAYIPTATSLSGMYGIGYSHPNFWGSGKGSGWGLYVANNGSIDATIGCEGTTSAWFAGIALAEASYRAPIFYDSNDTSYFLNPSASGGNALKTIGDWRQTTDSWSGEVGGKMQYHGTNWYIQAGASFIYRNSAGANQFYVDNTGTGVITNYLTGNNSLRSPIFYDSNDTTYYGDFAGTSNLNTLTLAGSLTVQSGSGTMNGKATQLFEHGYGSDSGTFYQTSGSFAGYSGWANYWIGNHGNGATYYNTVDIRPFWGPPKYSRLEGGTFRGPYNYVTNENDQTIGVYLQSTTSLRAPIFYDYNNTAFYLDPSTTGTSVNVAGDVVAYASSDIRFKNNITPITNALDKLSKIGGYTFEWNEISHKETGKKDIGVVAQEVEEILPEIVQTRSNGYKAVDYQKLTALLIESVKEQQVIINDLKTRIETLENN